MNTTIDEAQASLTDIERIMRDTRRSLAMRGTGTILIVWGTVWIVCFALNHFYPLRYGWIWGIGNVAGIAGTVLALVAGARTVAQPRQARFNWKFFWFWFSLFMFLDASMAIAFAHHPPTGQQIAAFAVLGIMFAYVVIGLMLDTRFMIGLGIAVSVLTLVGFFALHEHFYLWMSATGGGALLFSGVYVHRWWR